LCRDTATLWIEQGGRWCKLGQGQQVDPDSANAFDLSGGGNQLGYTYISPASFGGWILNRWDIVLDPAMQGTSGLGGGYPLAGIISEVGAAAGVPAATVDTSAIAQQVRGYLVSRQMSARAALEPVTQAHFVAAVESGSFIKWYPLGQGVVMDIPTTELGARAEGSAASPIMQLTRKQPYELPARISVAYNSFNAPLYDYADAEIHSDYIDAPTQQSTRQDVPMSLREAEARAIADAALARTWVSRSTAAFTTTRRYAALEPGDCITCRGLTLRILEKTEAQCTIKWLAITDDPSLYPFITADNADIPVVTP
jgi:hypothetical protein